MDPAYAYKSNETGQSPLNLGVIAVVLTMKTSLMNHELFNRLQASDLLKFKVSLFSSILNVAIQLN
jgi:hypothetical protein